MHQMRPAVRMELCVSVAFRVVNHKHDELRPAVSKELYQLRSLLEYYWRPQSSTACVSVASKGMGIQNPQQFEGCYTVLLYITVYTIVCTYTELLNDIYNAQMLYHVTV